MIRLAWPLCISAALGIAGCASTANEPLPAATMRTSDGTPVVSASASAGATASRAGFGIIESISLVNPPKADGATGPYRITLRMEDGSAQTVEVDNRAFLVGDRVRVQADGRLIRA